MNALAVAPDLAGWPTKVEAAQQLGVSPKSVERLAKEGRLEQRERAGGNGVRSVMVYRPEDVARVRQDDAKPASVLPAAREPAVDTLSPAIAGGFDKLAKVLADLSRWHEEQAVGQSLYVSLKDAQRITGLSGQTIKDLAEPSNGGDAIKTMPFGRGVRYRRADLEAL